MGVKIERKKTIPTYVPKEAIKLPMFFEHKPYQGASGRLYPLPFSDSITLIWLGKFKNMNSQFMRLIELKKVLLAKN